MSVCHTSDANLETCGLHSAHGVCDSRGKALVGQRKHDDERQQHGSFVTLGCTKRGHKQDLARKTISL